MFTAPLLTHRHSAPDSIGELITALAASDHFAQDLPGDAGVSGAG